MNIVNIVNSIKPNVKKNNNILNFITILKRKTNTILEHTHIKKTKLEHHIDLQIPNTILPLSDITICTHLEQPFQPVPIYLETTYPETIYPLEKTYPEETKYTEQIFPEETIHREITHTETTYPEYTIYPGSTLYPDKKLHPEYTDIVNNIKYKKDNIPKRIKELVWNTYNGEIYSSKCYVLWCNNIINVFNYHTGHDIPNSKGGTLSIVNLKPICSNCNLSMGNKYTITEWNTLLKN